MALFALINQQGIVENVAIISEAKLTGIPRPVPAEIIAQRAFLKDVPGTWVETSQTGAFRNKRAAIGDTYDAVNDVFISPQPYPSWALDNNYNWQPPVPMPDDGIDYTWDEDLLKWRAQ